MAARQSQPMDSPLPMLGGGCLVGALLSSALALVEPAQAHHSVTIDGNQLWCAGQNHSSDQNNQCNLSSKTLTSVPEDLFSGLSNLQVSTWPTTV